MCEYRLALKRLSGGTLPCVNIVLDSVGGHCREKQWWFVFPPACPQAFFIASIVVLEGWGKVGETGMPARPHTA